MNNKNKLILRAGVLVLLLALAVSCATNPVTGRPELMMLDDNQEIQLGRKNHQQILSSYGLYENHPVSPYLKNLGKRMSKLSHRPNLPYQFHVLDSPVVNAFAAPGGFIYMTRGILGYFNSEEELAGVLGHELGHITARHSAKQYSQMQLTQIAFAFGNILTSRFELLSDLAQFGAGMMFLRFSRDNERQADNLGVEYSLRAGYDARQMAGFFETLERLNPTDDKSGLNNWFSTHPNPPDRIRAVQNKARELAAKLGIKSTKHGRERYLRKIDGMMYGHDPRQGYVRDNSFFHPILKIKFPLPEKWKINNTPAKVQMQSPAKDAALVFTLKKGNSPKQAARDFVKRSGARVLSSKTIRVNGLSAFQLICDVSSGRDRLRLAGYFIKNKKNIFIFYGLSSPNKFNQYLPIFNSTATRFSILRSKKRINVRPDKLVVRSVKQPGTVETILKKLKVADKDLEHTAILNGRYLKDKVPASTLFKIIVRGNR